MLRTFGVVCIMGTKCNNERKTNREKTWLAKISPKISPLAKVFFRTIWNTLRHFPTGPGLFCEGCLFSGGRGHITPVFFDVTKAGESPFSPHWLFFRYFAGQDSATVETDASGPARLKAGRGQGDLCQAPCSPCCSIFIV